MEKHNLISNIIEKWLETSIQPQIQSVNVNTKKSNSFGSHGNEIVLVPGETPKKLTLSPVKELTFGFCQANYVAELREHPVLKEAIQEVIETPITENKPETKPVNETPTIGEHKCPLSVTYVFPKQTVTVRFTPFTLTPNKELFLHYTVIAKYLFYKGKFLSFEMFPVLTPEDKRTLEEYKQQYYAFLQGVICNLITFTPQEKKEATETVEDA